MQNLEEAYKKYQQEDVPDLWARIEAKSPEKKKKNTIISITRYLGLAAAALFICLVIPSMMRTAKGTDSADNAASIAMDAEMEEGYPEDTIVATATAGKDEGENDVNYSYSTDEEVLFDSALAPDTVTEYKEALTAGFSSEETLRENQTLQENLTVQEVVQCDAYKVLVLSSADGTIFRAQAPDSITLSFEIGVNYDFSLQEEQALDWDYLILAVE